MRPAAALAQRKARGLCVGSILAKGSFTYRRKRTQMSTRHSEIRALRIVPPAALASELTAEQAETQALLAKLLQRQDKINALLGQMQAQGPGLAKAPAPRLSQRQIEAAQEAKLLSALQGKTLWLPEAARAAGLSKQVADATARRLAYDRKLWMSLEPGPAGKLTFRLRSSERVAVE